MGREFKVEQLPTQGLTPPVVLANVAELEPETVIVLYKTKDGTVNSRWSQMVVSDLCFMARVFELHVVEAMDSAAGEDSDGN